MNARVRVRPARGDDRMAERRPEEWLLIEWPPGENQPTNYWLSNLAEDIAFERLVDLAKMRCSFPTTNSVKASDPAAAMSEGPIRTMRGSTTKQFRDQAEDCRSLAAKAPKAVDKAFWLRLSDYWLELGDEDKAPS